MRNRRWSAKASVVAGIVVGSLSALLAVAVSIPVAIVLGIVVGVGVGLLLVPASSAAAERAVVGTPVPMGAVPRIDSLVDVLCATFGVAPPVVTMIDDPVLNAALVERKGAMTMMLTTGLLEELSLVELEGVLAHLLSRQRLDAVTRGSVGAGLALLLGPIGRKPSVAHRLTGVGSLFRADEIAAVTVRYPTGLAEALRKMAGGPLPTKESFFSTRSFLAVRWLFVDPSIARRSAQEAFGDVDATSVRLSSLDEW